MTQLFRPLPGHPGYRAPGDATTLGYAGIGMQLVGGVASADAQRRQGAAAEAWGVSNQMALNAQAMQRINEANARAGIVARTGARQLGAIKAAYGAAGVEVESGTPLEVMADQASEIEPQRQLVLYQGQADATSLQQRGFLARMQGDLAQDAANTAAGTTLMTTAATAGMNIYNLSTIKPTGSGVTMTRKPSIQIAPS